MNHRSLRASPAASTALWCHCSSPLGVGEAAVLLGVRGGGEEEDLGADVLRSQLAATRSPGRPSTRSALSISEKSRTTSQSRLAMPSRCILALAEPTAGFSPIRK